MSSNDKAFSGSIPKVYETYLVPLIFEEYAQDLARRTAARAPGRVLEIAAGTGVGTRALAAQLPATTEIVATDLNPGMIEQAKAIGTARPVTWQQVDAMQVPFPDDSFDAVVIQFGVMFFPDKAKALGEVRRVLRRGGTLLFNVWDRLEVNEAADAVAAGVAGFFPDDPPRFLARAPYGYFDHGAIARDVQAGGFAAPVIETMTARGRAKAARDAAVGYCQGSPLRAEIEARGSLEQATDAGAKEVARRFGHGPIDTKIQAIIVTAGT